MMSRCCLLLLLAVVQTAIASDVSASGHSANDDFALVDARYVLPNGLKLIVSEDHRQPVVGITIWLHVGMKDDPQDKRGMAHLCEHLLYQWEPEPGHTFMGTMSVLGATRINAVTSQDRTAMYEIVPTSSLELALDMEARRLKGMTTKLTPVGISREIETITEEQRMDRDLPARWSSWIAKNTYPASHPYAHTVLGEVSDLAHVTPEDVIQWQHKYYKPSNAVIVIAGDISSGRVKDLITRYFGFGEPDRAVLQEKSWVAPLRESRRDLLEEEHQRARMYEFWNTPGEGSEDAVYLDLLSNCIPAATQRVLRNEMGDALSTTAQVGASIRVGEMGGQFKVTAFLGSINRRRMARAIREVLDRFGTDGPTEIELRQAKVVFRTDFLKNLDSLVGSGSRSDVLAMSEMFSGDPLEYQRKYVTAANAQSEDLRNAARLWLRDNSYEFDIEAPSAPGVALQTTSKVKDAPGQHSLELHRSTLSNGLHVVFSRQPRTHVVSMRLCFEGGQRSASPDQGASIAEIAAAALVKDATLDNGQLQARVTLNRTIFETSSLRQDFSARLNELASAIIGARVTAATIANEQANNPHAKQKALMDVNLVELRRQLSGTAATGGVGVIALPHAETVYTPDQILDYVSAWYRPQAATLVIVGDLQQSVVENEVAKVFASWHANGKRKPISDHASPSRRTHIFTLDVPGASQAFVSVAFSLPTLKSSERPAIQILADVVASSPASRLNQLLREQKRLTYGIGSEVWNDGLGAAVVTFGAFPPDRVSDAIQGMLTTYKQVCASQPLSTEEFERAKLSQVTQTSLTMLSTESLATFLADTATEGQLSDAWSPADRISQVTLSEVQTWACRLFDPNNATWVISFDRKQVPDLKLPITQPEVAALSSTGSGQLLR